jgi:hypothetical protein
MCVHGSAHAKKYKPQRKSSPHVLLSILMHQDEALTKDFFLVHAPGHDVRVLRDVPSG